MTTRIGWVMVTVSPQSPASGSRAALTLAVATVGLGLNVRAWVLLGPHLHERFDVGVGAYVALMGLPLLVATLVRLPVGVLTDLYGARVMFPAVSLAAAVTVSGVGLADSLPAAVAAGRGAGGAGGGRVGGAPPGGRARSHRGGGGGPGGFWARGAG